MRPLHRTIAILGFVAASACGSTGKGSGGGGSSSGGTGGGAFGSSASPASNTDGSFASNAGGSGGEAGVTLADNSSGTCVVGRTCDPVCDELVEGGQHEYVEPAPDDGSPLPPASAASLFQGATSTSGGPCIVEPPDGALFPNNWARPRIRFTTASASQTIFQIRVHAARQKNDLVVYTESKTWKLPKDIWTALAASTWGEDITVTVTAVSPSGGASATASSQVKFQIAPADANGSIVYWATVGKDAGQSWLESFRVGDENVAEALTVPQVLWRASRSESGSPSTRGASPGAISCIGCHVAVPDRQSVVFNDNWPWNGVASMVDPNDTGKAPSWLTPGGQEALGMPWLGMMTFSTHVWNDLNQHVVVAAFQGESTFPNPLPSYQFPDGGPQGIAPWGFQGSNEWDVSPASKLAWIDLSTSAPPVAPVGAMISGDQLSVGIAANEGKSWGFIERTGDSSGVAAPTWSHGGETIVYTSTNASRSGRLAQGMADLWSVPFNDKAGGAATPIRGASDANYNEYFPAFSPDDLFVAFNKTPVGDNMYYAPNGEVDVVPATGGTATRLDANDPPQCTGAKSPGVTNSWPKWSPEYPVCGGKKFYWLIFSSAREQVKFAAQSEPTSQLYLTALLVANETQLTTYPGIYIWNQHSIATLAPFAGQTQSNHTPQWEPIDLPVPPPPPPPPPPPK